MENINYKGKTADTAIDKAAFDKAMVKYLKASGYLTIHKEKLSTEAKVRGGFNDTSMDLAMCFEMLEHILIRSNLEFYFNSSLFICYIFIPNYTTFIPPEQSCCK